MTAADGAKKRYRFRDCEFDLDTRRLSRGGKPVQLEPRVFELLAFLIQERHRAVDKDAIQDAVWKTMVVSETALTRAIMKARRAVGDDADEQAVIRTVHGHGYQFIAPLEEDKAETRQSDAAAARQTAAATSRAPPRLRWLLIAAGVLLAVGIAMLWRQPVDDGHVRIAVLPVVNNTDDAELGWARFGLMGLANDLFADVAELDVVRAADVVRFAENMAWDGNLDAADAEAHIGRLRRSYGASHVLVSELERTVGGLRLNYTLVGSDGRRDRSTMVSEQSTVLVQGMVRGVTTLLSGRRHVLADGLRAVDDDPFINEAYARAMSTVLEGRYAEAKSLFDVVLARNRDLIRARIGRADCAYRLGEWEEAEAAFKRILDNDDVQNSDSLHAEVLARLGVVYHRTGRLERADATYRQGIELAQRAEDKFETGRLLTSMAILAKDRRNFTLARDLLARATLAYRQLEWELLPGQIYSTLANIAMNDGKLDEAEQHLDSALVSFRGIGDKRNEAMMLNNYGFLRRLQGRFVEAEDLHLQSLAIRRDIGDRVGQGRILGMLSGLYEREERFEAAKAASSEAVEIAREANDALFIATGLAQLAAAERGLGNLSAAREAYRESRDVFITIEDRSRAAQVELRLALLDKEENRLDDAESRVQAVLAEALAEDFPEPAIEAMQYAGDIAVLKADIPRGIQFYEQALEHVEATGFTSEKTAIAVKLANLHLDQGNISSVEPLLGYLIEQEPSVEILELQAKYAQATGDDERSAALMEEAQALAKGASGDEE